MRSRRSLVLAVAGLVLATATAAQAAPPYTVSVGGSSAAGTHPFTAQSTGVVSFNVKNDAGTVISWNCTSVGMSGAVTTGSGVNPLASITSTTWNNCRFPGGNLAVTQSGAWNLTGTGANATSGSESVSGYVGAVTAQFALAPSPATCSFTMTGQMNGSFDEATQRLVISETGYTGNLTLSGVGPCYGQLQNGNKANLAMTLDVSSPEGPIDLS